MKQSLVESQAVKDLGSRFNVTEIFLRDDGLIKSRDSFENQEHLYKLRNGELDSKKGESAETNGISSSPIDLELAMEMNDLGLPLSFGSKTVKKSGVANGRRRVTKKNSQQSLIEINDSFLDSIKVSEEESISPVNLLVTSKFQDQSEILNHGLIADVNSFSISLERGDSASSVTSPSENDTVTNSISIEDGSCLINMAPDCDGKHLNGELESALMRTPLRIDLDTCGDSSHWIQVWDDFHARTFFYNEKTGESTWDAPPDCENDTVTNSISIEDGSCFINMAPDCDGKDLNGELESALMRTPLRIDLHTCGDSSHWIQGWDDFYARTFFYNEKTGESTWDAPPGMENLAFFTSPADEPTKIMAESNELNDEEVLPLNNPLTDLYLVEECIESSRSIGQQLDETAGDGSVYTVKKKKKVKKTKPDMNISISSEGALQEITPIISRYWSQRYILFSKFDCGIQMDEEGWFSVTPEVLAKHHAMRCGSGSIIDLFTGVGGNAIQFAKWSKHVIAIDIDQKKIEFARHNAAIYGVEDKADTVFMSPPWGGPDYSKVKKFDINSMLKPRDGKFLFDVGRKIAPTVVMFLPRNVDVNQLAKLCMSASPQWSLEVEFNYLNDRLKAVTAYFRSSATVK